MNEVPKEDIAALVREKYAGQADAEPDAVAADVARLALGEPLAYVIGTQPFLGLSIGLGSKPLIPRPETEFWTEALIAHLHERFAPSGTQPFRLLDLCAGSGAIGLAVLARCPGAHVSFGELEPAHAKTIRANIVMNDLDEGRADIRTGDLFAPYISNGRIEQFDVIATNPPYVPSERTLPQSVAAFEPASALYAGTDGLKLIRRIATEAPAHLEPGGEMWLECDVSHADAAAALLREAGATSSAVHSDQYGRPRYVVARW